MLVLLYARESKRHLAGGGRGEKLQKALKNQYAYNKRNKQTIITFKTDDVDTHFILASECGCGCGIANLIAMQCVGAIGLSLRNSLSTAHIGASGFLRHLIKEAKLSIMKKKKMMH